MGTPAAAVSAPAVKSGSNDVWKVPTEPVHSQFGYHVILARPFDEVGEDLTELIATAPGDAALTGRLATGDITVDPRYGRWDAARGSVVSLR